MPDAFEQPVANGHLRIIPRAEHCISRANISQNALKVVYRLAEAGFQAFLVGGCVRDLLLGRVPKDFDVVTDARPEQVRELFRNCRLIGRRFRLAHVHFGREIIEVATFRAPHDAAEDDSDAQRQGEHGGLLRDNVYGTIDQDIWRRDFTINALYYNIADFSLWDFTSALEDLQAGRVRFIGEPRTRCREDAVRMLRAVRFVAKLGLQMDAATEQAILHSAELLQHIAPARLFDEILKLFQAGAGLASLEQLQHYGLFEQLFPATAAALNQSQTARAFVQQALANTDERVNADKPVNPAFLYAALLWEPVRQLAQQFEDQQALAEIPALQMAGSQIIEEQIQYTAMPRRYTTQVKEIWSLQPRFKRRRGSRPARLLEHPRFRAAYDFLCLRAQAGEIAMGHCEWWTQFQAAQEPERNSMLTSASESKRGGRRRSRRSRRKASDA